MLNGRFSTRDLIGVNPKINLRELGIKGWTHYPKEGDFRPESINENIKYDTKIFMKHEKGFIICREHRKKDCSDCKKLKP